MFALSLNNIIAVISNALPETKKSFRLYVNDELFKRLRLRQEHSLKEFINSGELNPYSLRFEFYLLIYFFFNAPLYFFKLIYYGFERHPFTLDYDRFESDIIYFLIKK